jgi:hypothetical protein
MAVMITSTAAELRCFIAHVHSTTHVNVIVHCREHARQRAKAALTRIFSHKPQITCLSSAVDERHKIMVDTLAVQLVLG